MPFVAQNPGAAAGAAAAAAAAVANATRAAGPILILTPEEFAALLARNKDPIIVISPFGVFETWYRYMMPYRGLYFATDSPRMLALPPHCEVVNATSIWVPHM